MQLTRFTDIGLRVVMRLAVSDGSMTTRVLAEEMVVPYTHVTKVTGRLAELGVVHSRRGRAGGLVITELGRTARIGWLAASLEGEGEVVDCDGETPCPLRRACRLRGALAAARRAFFDSLDDVTVGDLVTDPTGAVLLSLDPPRRAEATPHGRAESHSQVE
ncbi:Rrf2 family transcriptional regulator [Gordonia polyisoprenivorans]|uniref:RrF2 family transcriptional regulator n=1 Tax=Gordonia polyisoprenivorans TaxID=84595 RepID=UPI002234309E|nr:Rrf2 family transcriptional regulator [Gordonia polyisoprenivorans]